MSLADPALPVRADHNPITFTFDDRHWRVRGLESQLSCERLKVNLLVSRQDLTHIDTLDLYTSRQRRMFLARSGGRTVRGRSAAQARPGPRAPGSGTTSGDAH